MVSSAYHGSYQTHVYSILDFCFNVLMQVFINTFYAHMGLTFLFVKYMHTQ